MAEQLLAAKREGALRVAQRLARNPVVFNPPGTDVEARVVTPKLIDQLHGSRPGHANEALSRLIRKGRLKAGKHYFAIAEKDAPAVFAYGANTGNLGDRPVYLVTEKGYTMLVKSYRDDLSWEIQDRLSDTYWAAREIEDRARRAENRCARLEAALLALLDDRERESRDRASGNGRGLSARRREIATQRECRELIGQIGWTPEDLFGQEYLEVGSDFEAIAELGNA